VADWLTWSRQEFATATSRSLENQADREGNGTDARGPATILERRPAHGKLSPRER